MSRGAVEEVEGIGDIYAWEDKGAAEVCAGARLAQKQEIECSAKCKKVVVSIQNEQIEDQVSD